MLWPPGENLEEMLESHELRRDTFGDVELPFSVAVFSDVLIFGKLGLLGMVFVDEGVSAACALPFCVDFGSLTEVGEAGWDFE